VETLDSAISADAWRDCADEAGTMEIVKDRVTVCFDVSLDMQHATLVAATIQGDGRARLAVVQAWSGPGCTQGVRDDLPGLLERIKPRRLGWYPSGPAASLAADLKLVRNAQELKAAEALTACQELAEQVTARRVIHGSEPLLNDHVLGAQRLPSGDGWRFTRRMDGSHVDAAYAAAGALHLARSLPVLRPMITSWTM
jgi:hypothetical protein